MTSAVCPNPGVHPTVDCRTPPPEPDAANWLPGLNIARHAYPFTR